MATISRMSVKKMTTEILCKNFLLKNYKIN